MSDLRTQLIRLAHAHPEFRKDILPLLKEAGGPATTGDNWVEEFTPHRWVWTGSNGFKFSIVEGGRNIPFYKMTLFLPDGSRYESARQTKNVQPWFSQAAGIYKDYLRQGEFFVMNLNSSHLDKWNRIAHRHSLLKEAGCEKLPEGGMRDNCEAKKEEGKDKKAWIDSNNLNVGSISNKLQYLARDLQEVADLPTYDEVRPIVKALRLQMVHLELVLKNLASRG